MQIVFEKERVIVIDFQEVKLYIYKATFRAQLSFEKPFRAGKVF